jgi:hypothetical protein
MAEIQASQAPPATPAPPPQAAPAAAPVQGAPPPSTGVDITKANVSQLRKILQQLKSERGELASRRSNTESSYENASGESKAGLGKRLNVLDDNIMLYEREIARVGQEYALRGGGSVAEVEPGTPIPSGYINEGDAAGMAFGFSFATMLLTFFVVRRFMRRKYGGLPAARQQQNVIGSSERLDRIEQAVDTIAVEIERVSENQRFMTRLMTETQLGETIKDVKKSAELAKSAAESSG